MYTWIFVPVLSVESSAERKLNSMASFMKIVNLDLNSLRYTSHSPVSALESKVFLPVMVKKEGVYK